MILSVVGIDPEVVVAVTLYSIRFDVNLLEVGDCSLVSKLV